MTNNLIDRQKAIDALGEEPLAWESGEYELGCVNQWKSDVEAIKALPPAEPRKGKWINGKCNRCGERAHAPFWAMANTYHYSNFCPNCGARMEGIDE